MLTNNRRDMNLIAWGLTSLLLAIWLIAVLRCPPSRESDLVALAGIAALTLLPIYHRLYDARILILAIPGLLLIVGRRRLQATALVVLMTCVFLSTNKMYRVALSKLEIWSGGHFTFILSRQAPLFLLVIAVMFLQSYMNLTISQSRLALNSRSA
jgi:hypothetical protein